MIQKFYLDVIDHIHKNNVENKNFYWYGFITGDIEKTVDNDKRVDKMIIHTGMRTDIRSRKRKL